MVKVVAQMEFPRSVVYGILADFGKYVAWVPGCEKSVVTSSNGNIYNVDMAVSTGKRVSIGLKYECEQDVIIRFEMTQGTDMKAYSGSYRMMNSADNNGTVLMTELDVDAGPMAPKFMVDRLMKKTVEDTNAALKKYARTLPQPASTGPVEVDEPAAAKPKRARCVLRVVKTDSGEEQVWYGGKTFAVK